MKWPKEWLKVLKQNKEHENILEGLYQVGALKEPPKAREWFLCGGCFARIIPDYGRKCIQCESDKIIPVREILE